MSVSNPLFRLCGVAAVAVPLVLTSAPNTTAQTRRGFNLQNNTGYTLQELYISPTVEEYWEDDYFAQRNLGANQSTNITINDGRNGVCLYDIYAIFSNGIESTDYEVDVCNLSQNYVFSDVVIRNQTSSNVNALYISRSSYDDWGDDKLGDRIISAGTSTDVVVGYVSNDCSYDLFAIFDDEKEVDNYYLDICELATTGYEFYDKK